MPTYLMCDSKRGVKPVVLDDSTASLRGADSADVCHAQGVAGVVATEVLEKGNTACLNQHLHIKCSQGGLPDNRQHISYVFKCETEC